LRLSKLANWFKNTDSKADRLEAQPNRPEIAKLKLEIEKLNEQLQQAHKQTAQLKAQLQINQGFQIELGETQLKLQNAQTEAQRYKKELFESQKRLDSMQSQITQAQQKLAKFQNWEQQLKTPIQITDITKTLPKQEFDTLWGFGIISPQAEFTTTTGAIVVKGWVLGKKSPAETLRVIYDDHTLLETPVKLRRPIVVQRYPDIPTANSSGFEFAFSVAGISATTQLNLHAVLADKTEIALCDITLNPQLIESNDTQTLIQT
jgi:hypothetical protein